MSARVKLRMKAVSLKKCDPQSIHNLHGALHLNETNRKKLRPKSLNSSLSSGLLVGQKLVGYILASIRKSSLDKHFNEPVIFVENIAILPKYRVHLINFLMPFLQ